jgi:cytochrome b6-f complex iron-sulfur subunit
MSGLNLNRRQFLLLSAAFLAGCKTADDAISPAGGERTVDAGPAGDYAADGVYNRFQYKGFFVVRQGEKLFALSAICTHRKCRLAAEPDRTFYCKCHGSTFDPAGHVTEGPARRDLPVYPVSTDARGRLLVTIPG